MIQTERESWWYRKRDRERPRQRDGDTERDRDRGREIVREQALPVQSRDTAEILLVRNTEHQCELCSHPGGLRETLKGSASDSPGISM